MNDDDQIDFDDHRFHVPNWLATVGSILGGIIAPLLGFAALAGAIWLIVFLVQDVTDAPTEELDEYVAPAEFSASATSSLNLLPLNSEAADSSTTTEEVQLEPGDEPISDAAVVEELPPPVVEPVASEPQVVISETPTGYLNIRLEPNTSSEIIGRTVPGKRYDLIQKGTDWMLVDFGEFRGWVSAEYVTVED